MNVAPQDVLARTAPWRTVMWVAVALALLAPLVAMRFTDEVTWTAGDFAVAAILLGGGAYAFDLVVRTPRLASHRRAIGAALALVVALIWAEGAVGIFH